MRMLVFALLLAATACGRPAAAACLPYRGAIALDFTTLRPAVRTDTALNTTGIRELVRGQVATGIAAGGEPLGLTIVNPVFTLDARTRLEPQPDGVCVYLETLKVSFGYRDMTVYVASEYPPGSCEYRAILDHERQHVAIAMRALDSHAGRIRLALERVLAGEKPLATRAGRQSTQQILNRLSARMDGELAPFYRELDERNGAIDSQHNYDAIAAICKDWARGNVWPQR